MSRIVWDNTGEKYFESGVSMGVLYPQATDGTYEAGVAWNGLTAVNESPSGADPTDLWADNQKYATLRSAESFGGTIEAYTYPAEFEACDGSASPVAGVHIRQQGRKPFGFCYRTEIGSDTMAIDSNDGYKLHLIYNASASPSARNYGTINESPDAITFSWEFTTTPVPVTGYKSTAVVEIDSRDFATTEKRAKLTALENLLYGTDGQSGTAPQLPDIATVISTLT